MATNLKSWVLYINRPMWQSISENTQVFMLCHEEEHLLAQSKNEFRTDKGGFKKYISSGRSLKDSVYAIVNFLDMQNPESRWRAILQLDRALKYDYEVNGNKKAFKERYRDVEDAENYFKKIKIEGMAYYNGDNGGAYIDEHGSLVGYDGVVLQFGDPSAVESGDYYLDYSGDEAHLFGGKWRKKAKAEKKAAKSAQKRSAAELTSAQAFATRTLAEKGIAFNPGPSKFAQGVGAVAGLVGNILGGGGAAPQETPQDTTQLPPQQAPTPQQQMLTPTAPYVPSPYQEEVRAENPNVLQGILSALVGGAIGKTNVDSPPAQQPPQEKKKDKTLTFVLIGLGVLALGAVVFAITKKQAA